MNYNNTKCNYIPNINLDIAKHQDYEIIEHDINKNIPLKERLNIAKNMLDKYRTAEQVITTRLHCILPCRAFNTEAIFIHKNYNHDPRFEGLKDIINGDTQKNNRINGDRDSMQCIRDNFLNLDITD